MHTLLSAIRRKLMFTPTRFVLVGKITITRVVLDRGAYSRQPFDRLTVIIGGRVKEQLRWNSLAVTIPQQCFYTLWPCDLDLWPFDLILIGERGIVIDYLCAKFRDFSFSRFWFYRADRHTNRITDRKNHRSGLSLYSRDYRRREK